MSRKQLFSNLGQPPTSDRDETELPRTGRLRMRPILGAPELVEDACATPVGAIGQSLGAVAEKAKRADDIERRLAEGQIVIELDPWLVDPSFISDRMPAEEGKQTSLLEAIRDNGQQVPILVRPHPTKEGRYQVAYGHRRLKAITELGQRIRAVVRVLSDEELVVAQGQENNERRDLSYIEKARFAHGLERKFGRPTAMEAMSLYKSDLSNMLSVVSRIPAPIVDAIGPAPASGRRAWIELADLIAKKGGLSSAERALHDEDFTALASDDRLKRVLAAAKPSTLRGGEDETWADAKGRKLATVVTTSTRISMTIDRRGAPDFARFVIERLQDLYQEFEAGEKSRP